MTTQDKITNLIKSKSTSMLVGVAKKIMDNLSDHSSDHPDILLDRVFDNVMNELELRMPENAFVELHDSL